jgi:hypothetical protein
MLQVPARVVIPSTNVTVAGNDDLDVPMAWLWAEQGAEDLIRRADASVSPVGFEFRAARDVLALTMLFSGFADGASALSACQLKVIRRRLSAGSQWLPWCQSRLAAAGIASTDLALARNAWDWLTGHRLLLACEHPELVCGKAPAAPPASVVGLRQALSVIDAHLTGPAQGAA